MGARGNTEQHLKTKSNEKGLILFLLPGPSKLDYAGGLSTHISVGPWQLVLRLVVCLLCCLALRPSLLAG